MVLWGGAGGGKGERTGRESGCGRGEREREKKIMQHFNFMSAFTPLEWRRGK